MLLNLQVTKLNYYYYYYYYYYYIWLLLLLLLQQIDIFVSVNIAITISITMNHVKTHVLKQSFPIKIGNSLGLLKHIFVNFKKVIYFNSLCFRFICLPVPLKGNKIYHFYGTHTSDFQ